MLLPCWYRIPKERVRAFPLFQTRCSSSFPLFWFPPLFLWKIFVSNPGCLDSWKGPFYLPIWCNQRPAWTRYFFSERIMNSCLQLSFMFGFGCCGRRVRQKKKSWSKTTMSPWLCVKSPVFIWLTERSGSRYVEVVNIWVIVVAVCHKHIRSSFYKTRRRAVCVIVLKGRRTVWFTCRIHNRGLHDILQINKTYIYEKV